LVITATGAPDVDAMVYADAEAAGVWVNSADDPGNCSFILPSVHRDGPVTIAVSTSGSSPALATWLRGRLAEASGPGTGALAELLGRARAQVQASGRGTDAVDWAALLDGPLPGLVSAGQMDEAVQLVEAAISK
jgi:siroheme synthase-like protein